MEPIVIKSLKHIVVNGVGTTQTSKFSFCTRWQRPFQSSLASRSGRRPNYKNVCGSRCNLPATCGTNCPLAAAAPPRMTR